MKQYLDLVRAVLGSGKPRPTRTSERVVGIFDYDLTVDLDKGFPLITTKTVNFGAVAAELLGFLHGATSAAQFRDFGTRIWDANANDPGSPEAPNAWLSNPNRKGADDLGRIYGAQWRDWCNVAPDLKVTRIDQIANLVKGLREDPFGRRHLVSAWNPGELDQMALPPCHVLFQCYVEGDDLGKPRILHMKMYQRSVDVFLGLPFNIASYALLTHMLAHVTGLIPGKLTLSLGDVHVYESHIPEMLVQLRRAPKVLPRLRLGNFKIEMGVLRVDRSRPITSIDEFTSLDQINLEGYNPHGPLKGKMAV